MSAIMAWFNISVRGCQTAGQWQAERGPDAKSAHL